MCENRKTFDFSHALTLLKQGKRIRRSDWSAGSYFVMTQVGHLGKGLSVFYKYTSSDGLEESLRLTITTDEIFAEDYEELEE